MIKQYKLRFYNFRLLLFLLAISSIGVVLVGTAREDLMLKQLMGVIMGLVIMVDPVSHRLFLDLKLSVDHVRQQYRASSDRTPFWRYSKRRGALDRFRFYPVPAYRACQNYHHSLFCQVFYGS